MELHWEETPEEKHKRVDEILEKNSNPLVCITCGQLITDRQNAIKSQHGPYHGAPMACVDGRQELPWYQN